MQSPEFLKKFEEKQQVAKNRLSELKKCKKSCIEKMQSVYGVSPECDLSITEKIDIDSLPVVRECRHCKTTMIFRDDLVYKFIHCKKNVFFSKLYFYNINSHLSKINRKIGLDIDRYCISIIDDKPYINVISSSLKYNYTDFTLLGRDLSRIYETEPFDVSISCYLLINGKIPFNYYRFDNNATANMPHLNRMKDKTVLSSPIYILGPHQHIYSELQSILYPSFPYSYDAYEVSAFEDTTNSRKPLQKKEINRHITNFLNIEFTPKTDNNFGIFLGNDFSIEHSSIPSELINQNSGKELILI